MRNINQRYVTETFDNNGLLKDFRIDCPPGFNFAYDVVDDIAVNDPDRRALVWAHENGESKTFTFADIKRLSDKTCNYLKAKGLKKGDFVILVMKHSYQFWYLTVAGVLVHSLTTRVLLGRWHRRYHSDCDRPMPRDTGHHPGYHPGDRGWR